MEGLLDAWPHFVVDVCVPPCSCSTEVGSKCSDATTPTEGFNHHDPSAHVASPQTNSPTTRRRSDRAWSCSMGHGLARAIGGLGKVLIVRLAWFPIRTSSKPLHAAWSVSVIPSGVS